MDIISGTIMWGRNVAMLLDDVVVFAKPQLARMEHTLVVASPAVRGASGVIIDDTAVGGAAVAGAGIQQHREYAVLSKLFIGDLCIKLILSAMFTVLQSVLPILPKVMLLLGAGYLVYEGAHKIWGLLAHTRLGAALNIAAHNEEAATAVPVNTDTVVSKKSSIDFLARTLGVDPNERRVLTELLLLSIVLSTEIILVAMSLISEGSTFGTLQTLAIVSLGTAVLVILPMLCIARADNVAASFSKSKYVFIRNAGARLLQGLVPTLRIVNVIGTAAMLNVGGEILIKKLPVFIEIFSVSTGESLHKAFEMAEHFCSYVPAVGGIAMTLIVGLVCGLLISALLTCGGRAVLFIKSIKHNMPQ